MIRKIRKYSLQFLLVLAIPLVLVFLLNAFLVVDIRPEIIKAGITEEMETKGRKLLTEMENAHGKNTWLNTQTWSVDYNAKWKIPVAWMANHWPNNEQNVRFDAVTNSFDSRAILLDGSHKNEVWGIQSWQPYKKKPKGQVQFKDDANLAFGNPTVHYFIELPFRASGASIVAYAGTKIKNDIKYELVFISWLTAKPNKDSDQYVLYINKNTKRLDLAAYTVREQFNFLNSTVTYQDYVKLDGILFPSRFYNRIPYMKFLTFHDGQFSKWKLNQVSPKELRPNPNLKILKDEKI